MLKMSSLGMSLKTSDLRPKPYFSGSNELTLVSSSRRVVWPLPFIIFSVYLSACRPIGFTAPHAKVLHVPRSYIYTHLPYVTMNLHDIDYEQVAINSALSMGVCAIFWLFGPSTPWCYSPTSHDMACYQMILWLAMTMSYHGNASRIDGPFAMGIHWWIPSQRGSNPDLFSLFSAWKAVG